MYSVCICFFFFFKQKTAYEMRISDWSSDVCSSDLLQHLRHHAAGAHQAPDMLDRLDAAELHEAGAGDGVDRLTCRLGNQVQLVAGHLPASARRVVFAWPVPAARTPGTTTAVFPSVKHSLTTTSRP